MKRRIDTELRNWKSSPVRRPLLVRGARQVGKTFSVLWFGQQEFGNCIAINFEERPEFQNCFTSLDVGEILEKISILTGEAIHPGKTLLFLDEIQECPKAITSLRYFFEKKPDLHVIGAGSLLEFVFREEGFRMPVGRISSLYMAPLSFDEFLVGIGQEKLLKYLISKEKVDPIEPLFADELEKLLRKYLVVGGMPAVVAHYAKGGKPEEIKVLQTSILQTYQADFSKYASTAKHKYLQDVFVATPRLACSRCKYSHINAAVQSREIKLAVELLADARCLHMVKHSSGMGLPLAAQVNPKIFKLLFMDVGLMQRALEIDTRLILEKDLMSINRGSVAEQFVGQQLLAVRDLYEEPSIFFWARENRSSQAEVDYLVTLDGLVFPVEVKAGKTGTLKSLRLFLDEHPESPFGIRFSLHELSWHDRVLSIPLTMIGQWQRLVRLVLAGGDFMG